MTKYVKIKQATDKGYALCKVGGVFNGGFPTSKTRRGRVENGGEIAPTIMASGTEIYRIEEVKNE